MTMLLLILLFVPGIISLTVTYDKHKVTIVDQVLKQVLRTDQFSDTLHIRGDFETIDPMAFNDPRNLKNLTLQSFSIIREIPPIAFLQLKQLEVLTIIHAGESIESTYRAFIGLINLKTLNVTGLLHNNSEGQNFIGLPKTTNVIVRGNDHLTPSPLDAAYNLEPYRVACINANDYLTSLEEVDLEVLRYVVRSCSRVRLLDNYQSTTIYSSGSGKFAVDLGNLNIKGFNAGWYRLGHPGAEVSMGISQNSISEIGPEALNLLPPEVTSIDFIESNVSVVKGRISNKYLRTLALISNSIDTIEEYSLYDTVIEDLLLTDNNLGNNEFAKTLPSSIRLLNLNRNKISRLVPHGFKRLSRMSRLILDSNRFGIPPAHAFEGLENLWALSAVGNTWETAPLHVFNGLPGLMVEYFRQYPQLRDNPIDMTRLQKNYWNGTFHGI